MNPATRILLTLIPTLPIALYLFTNLSPDYLILSALTPALVIVATRTRAELALCLFLALFLALAIYTFVSFHNHANTDHLQTIPHDRTPSSP